MATPLLAQFPSLAAYPPSFLKDLLSSPELTEAFLFSLPEVTELVGEVEQLGRENVDLAQQNLALRDELIALRDATAQSYSHAEAQKARWVELDKTQANLYQRQRPSFLHMRLKHSLTAQDEASEKIATAFIEGSTSGAASRTDSPAPGTEGERVKDPVDQFINEFKAARKTYHKRNIWAERWSRGEVAWRDD